MIRSWQRESVQVVAPALFRYEIISVLRKSVYRRVLSPDDAVAGREFLLEYPVELWMDDDLLRRGYDLATRFNQPTAYDAQYLAAAERLECEFWTADQRLFNAVGKDLAWVRWLGNFEG